MELILLKSSACLLTFIAFYKVVLERTSNHMFKRYYLLSVVIISIGIPFITFIEYIEPQIVLGNFSPLPWLKETSSIQQEGMINILPIILWSIYGFGVFLFSARFAYNLTQILLKIKRNPKMKTTNFINVLLQDLIEPHTFFSYIFLNKTRFENKEIPKEVLLHEETHAKQKHSLDILFIELIQIVFWFNPLVYILKKDIKLNHEFLADQAVINQGINTSNYQKLLLEFSSSSKTNHLANAINYSLIKKRFTVMKTKTSKQNLWFRSTLLLPLLAVLIYGFSTPKQIEVVPKMTINQTTEGHKLSQERMLYNHPIAKKELVILIRVNKITINGELSSIKTFKDDLNAITSNWEETDFTSIKPKVHITNSSQDFLNQVEREFMKTKFSKANKGMKLIPPPPPSPAPQVVKAKLSEVPPPPAPRVVKGELSNVPPPPVPEDATLEQKKKYEATRVKYEKNRQERMKKLESKRVQKMELHSKERELAMKERQLKMVERESKMVERKSEMVNREKEKELLMKERELVMKDRKLANKERQLKKEHHRDVQPPKSPLDHVTDMSKKGAIFYYNGKKITSDKAIVLLKENESLNILTNSNDGVSTVKISTKPITIDD